MKHYKKIMEKGITLIKKKKQKENYFSSSEINLEILIIIFINFLHQFCLSFLTSS